MSESTCPCLLHLDCLTPGHLQTHLIRPGRLHPHQRGSTAFQTAGSVESLPPLVRRRRNHTHQEGTAGYFIPQFSRCFLRGLTGTHADRRRAPRKLPLHLHPRRTWPIWCPDLVQQHHHLFRGLFFLLWSLAEAAVVSYQIPSLMLKPFCFHTSMIWFTYPEVVANDDFSWSADSVEPLWRFVRSTLRCWACTSPSASLVVHWMNFHRQTRIGI